jgi:hypothetical protein
MPKIHGKAGGTEWARTAEGFAKTMGICAVSFGLISFVYGFLFSWNIYMTGIFVLILAGLWKLTRHKINRYFDAQLEKLTHHLKGAKGEQRVGWELEDLGPQYHVFHDMSHEHLGGNIDHLVVGPTGVFAIETKNWIGSISIDRFGEPLWNGYAYRKRHAGTLITNSLTIKQWIGDVPGKQRFYIQAIMVFPSAFVDLKSRNENKNVRFTPLSRLNSLIQAEPNPIDKLSEEQIQEIVKRIEDKSRIK